MASRWCARYMFYGEDLNIAGVRAGLYTGARPSLGSLERAPSGLIDPTTSWGIHVQIVLSALAPGGRRRARRHHRARRKAVLAQNVAMGAQHVVAMFGSTVLAPLLMGFDPNVAILMSGIGTLIFFLFVGGRVPSYLGSSFAFIGGVIAVTGYAGGARQYRRGAGRHHRLRPGLYPDRPDRLGR